MNNQPENSRASGDSNNAPAHWYGVKFEPLLPELMEMLGR